MDIREILLKEHIGYTLYLDLQFFADDGQGGEKTEPATQKKLDDARKEGQVAKSKEIASGLGLVALFLVLKFWASSMGTQFLEMFHAVYGRIPEMTDLVGGTGPKTAATQIFRFAALRTVLILLPIFIIGYLVAFLSDYIQVQWKPTAKPLQPKLSKLNPLNGF